LGRLTRALNQHPGTGVTSSVVFAGNAVTPVLIDGNRRQRSAIKAINILVHEFSGHANSLGRQQYAFGSERFLPKFVPQHSFVRRYPVVASNRQQGLKSRIHPFTSNY
jgi:hypothetical protein